MKSNLDTLYKKDVNDNPLNIGPHHTCQIYRLYTFEDTYNYI